MFGSIEQIIRGSIPANCLTFLAHHMVFYAVVTVFFWVAPLKPATGAEDPGKDIFRQALSKTPENIDASPLPNYSGDFVSIGAEGAWHRPIGAQISLFSAASINGARKQDCSPEAIVHYAQRAPATFEADKNGLLYGVKTHTPETRLTTRYWDMPGFNSCALVVYAILKEAGCQWAKYTANAKAIYDMAYKSGWRPSDVQKGGCMVAWNSKWEGSRARIGTRQKQVKSGSTLFRHVGIATGSWLSVDNSSWLSRPTTFITFRPVVYENPIFLCPPKLASGKEARHTPIEK